MYRRQLFKVGLAQSVLGNNNSGADGGDIQDPSWSSADVGTNGDAAPSRKSSGSTSTARLLSSDEASMLFRMGSVDACDTQRLIDAVIPPEVLNVLHPIPTGDTAERCAPVGVVARHLSRLQGQLGPACCVGTTRHDSLLGLTEERLTALRARAGLPCAALANATDVPPHPEEVAAWFSQAAASMLLGRNTSCDASVESATAAAACATGEASTMEVSSAVIAESLCIQTQVWVLTALARVVPRAAQHLRALLKKQLTPAGLLSALVAMLGPGSALVHLRRVERLAVKEWSMHGRRGECGHSHCCSITAATAEPGSCPRLFAFLALHPELSPPAGGYRVPLPPVPSGVTQGPMLGKRPRDGPSNNSLGSTPAAAAYAVQPAAGVSDATAIMRVAADIASVSVLLSSLGDRAGANNGSAVALPICLSQDARNALASAHVQIRSALSVLLGSQVAGTPPDPFARLRAISMRLIAPDASAGANLAALRAAAPLSLVPWAINLSCRRVVSRVSAAITSSGRVGAASAGSHASGLAQRSGVPGAHAAAQVGMDDSAQESESCSDSEYEELPEGACDGDRDTGAASAAGSSSSTNRGQGGEIVDLVSDDSDN